MIRGGRDNATCMVDQRPGPHRRSDAGGTAIATERKRASSISSLMRRSGHQLRLRRVARWSARYPGRHEQAAEIMKELHRQAAVEAELVADFLDRCFVVLVPQSNGRSRAIARVAERSRRWPAGDDGSAVAKRRRTIIDPRSYQAAGKIQLVIPGPPCRAEPGTKNTGQAPVSRAGVHGFRAPSLRSGPGSTAM